MCPNSTTEPTKTCVTCGETKPLTPGFYHRSNSSKDGYRNECKKCRSIKEGFRYIEPPPNGMLRCSTCEKIKPATTEYFAVDCFTKRGFQYSCKECNHNYYQENAEYKKRYTKQWAEKNKDRVSKKGKEFRARNKEKLSQIGKEYYRQNREKILNRVSLWKKANPEKVRVINRCREAKEYESNGTHTQEDVLKQYKRQCGRCYYCHKKVRNVYHVDHIVPLNRGGGNDPDNLVIACPSCNCSKQDKLPHEWAEGGRLL